MLKAKAFPANEEAHRHQAAVCLVQTRIVHDKDNIVIFCSDKSISITVIPPHTRANLLGL